MMDTVLFPPRLRSWVSLLALATAAFLAGCSTQPKERVVVSELPATQQVRAEQNLEVFHSVWDLVNRKHYAPSLPGVDWERSGAIYGPRAAAAPDEATLYGTLNEMLDVLHDSHTHALTPWRAEERRTSKRARTGFSMSMIDDVWVVADVLPESPAAKAGVAPGWIVVKRNGEALARKPEFRPTEGELVTWEFLDPADKPVVVTLKAERLWTGSQKVAREMPGGYVYLRFDEFDRTDRRWLSRQLRANRDAPGIVVDLRRNPGGETFSLWISIGEFFDRSVDCGTFISRAGRRKLKDSWQLGSAGYRGRVVVLVDINSASAAEIFAAVLKDHGRAVIVGRKTAGAVLASWFYSLPDGGELQLSREDYIAPNGRRIETNGVEPDVVVTRALADVRAGRDPDLEAALAILRDGVAPRLGPASPSPSKSR